MPRATLILLSVLGAFATAFAVVWARELTRHRQWSAPTLYESFVGFVTELLDALGIGSFATTTTLYRLRGTVPDEKIPGTLNVGHCLPACLQAVLFAGVISVESKTLVLLVGASVLGAWLGAGVVSRLSRRRIQVGMGVALLVAAALLVVKIYGLAPAGEDALALEGGKLLLGAAGTFIIGALMTIGIGAYTPIMIMVSLLGMNPIAAWPIMSGACAFLMPVAGARFIRAGAYAPRAALGLTLAGVPGVLVAVYIIKQLPLTIVRWLVLVVVIYTAITLLMEAQREGRQRTGPS